MFVDPLTLRNALLMSEPIRPSSANHSPVVSASYRLATRDQEFLLGDSMRGVRFQLEYAHAEEALRAWGVRSTLVAFGSSRVRESGPGKQPFWYAEARKFGRIASQLGGALSSDGGQRDNVIATGGGPGLMEAANRGAADARAPSIGFNITLPHEQAPNPYSTPELTFLFHYFHIRKFHLARRANALVVFPGGLGTLNELFEALNLTATGKTERLPVILFDEEYWRAVLSFEALVENGMINEAELGLFAYAETAEDAWAKLM